VHRYADVYLSSCCSARDSSGKPVKEKTFKNKTYKSDRRKLLLRLCFKFLPVDL
jgi:hypothetical protein